MPDYYKVRNRETLKRLDCGMEITRAVKHEPIDSGGLSRGELIELTNDRNGSKFLAEWQLPALVDWLEQQILALGWRFPPGAQTRVHVPMDRDVGYVSGRLVRTITIMVSGRWVHAYPDND
jgi:hypothetical protein